MLFNHPDLNTGIIKNSDKITISEYYSFYSIRVYVIVINSQVFEYFNESARNKDFLTLKKKLR